MILILTDGLIPACVKPYLTVAQISSQLSLLPAQTTVDIVQVCSRQRGRTVEGETLLAARLAALLASFWKMWCDGKNILVCAAILHVKSLSGCKIPLMLSNDTCLQTVCE